MTAPLLEARPRHADFAARVVHDGGGSSDESRRRASTTSLPGADVRRALAAPITLVIADRRAVLLSLPLGRNTNPGMLFTTDPDHLAWALRAFEDVWSCTEGAGPNEVRGVPRRQRILDLLAQGMTDATIAKRLGIGERTVRREVTELMKAVGATTRFQLGLLAHGLDSSSFA
ncbi:helix-turn-helix transcriptional regulator [Streptomyces sp. NPDC048057]|uniref:helix-turn-helix transcriptional regulator n=1 Tax=Streptomyces sp. NPDC048057 TaxID=3155628 RepID=UPI0033FAFE9B